MASVAFPYAATCSDLVQAMRIFWRSPQLISRRTRIPLRLQQSNRDVLEGDDSMRLHLVALACEIIVLVRLMDQELPATAGESVAQEIRASCLEHRSAVEQLLSASDPTQQDSRSDLHVAIAAMYKRLANVRRLRERANTRRRP